MGWGCTVEEQIAERQTSCNQTVEVVSIISELVFILNLVISTLASMSMLHSGWRSSMAVTTRRMRGV